MLIPKEKTDLFNKVATLCMAVRKEPVKDQVWIHVIGNWMIAVNGFKRHQICSPRNSMPCKIPPLSMVFWCGGYYVGWCNCNHAIIYEEAESKTGKVVFDVEDLERLINEEIKKYQ